MTGNDTFRAFRITDSDGKVSTALPVLFFVSRSLSWTKKP